ncbi:MAG: tetratricopeptide repeat protein [Nitrospirota bacterium]|nr:tetratricopeptide repeat protein [Nitrospirota bacterium]
MTHRSGHSLATFAPALALFGVLALLAPGCKGSIESQLETASLEMQQGAYDHAAEIYTDVLKQVPNAPNLHNNLGYSLLQLGRYEESLQHFSAAYEQTREDPDPVLIHNWGTALEKLNRLEEAEAKFAQAAGLDPTRSQVFVNWGNVLTRLKRPDEALERYSDAVRINTTDAVAWFNLGYTQEQMNRNEEAIRSFQNYLANVDQVGASSSNYEHARAFVAQAEAAGHVGGERGL